MPEDTGELMAILASDMSDGAKLAAIAELAGAHGAAEIAKALNKQVRTVERHYAELRRLRKSAGTQICGTQKCGNPQICVEKPADLRTDTTQICVDAPRAPASMTPRATKELPSEVSSIEVKLDSPSSVPPKLKTKGTRLPSDWQLPSDWRQWTRQRFVHSDDAMVSEVAEQFRDFWIAKTGSAATKLDWQATWRNWCRNDKTLTGIARPRPINGGRLAFDESNARRLTAREASVEHAKAELARLDAMYAS